MKEVLRLAEEQDLDVVEIAPQAEPPVVKIMDFGKFRYEQERKQKESSKKQTKVKTKEIKIRPMTEPHDYDFKLKNLIKFLEKGDRVKMTITFRGREIVTSKQLGFAMLEKIATDVAEVGTVEQKAKLEGKNLVTIFNPVKK
jgi:translation initiation factor IF-3